MLHWLSPTGSSPTGGCVKFFLMHLFQLYRLSVLPASGAGSLGDHHQGLVYLFTKIFHICFHATFILNFFFFRFVLSELTTKPVHFLYFKRCGAINHQPIVHLWFLSVICALVALLTDLQTTHMGETGSTLHLAFFLL